MSASPQVVAFAADVVAAWLAQGTSPRDAIAAMPAVRGLATAERAAVARSSAFAIARRRRLEFGLGGASGLGHLAVREHSLCLVLAVAVEDGIVSPDDAARRLAAATGERLDFAPLRRPLPAAEAGGEAVVAFGRRHSLPDWFAAAALAQFGSEADAVAAALAGPPPRTLRANLLRVADRQALAAELAREGIATQAARHAATALHVEGDDDVFASAAFRRGAFEQQDEASQLAALVVAPPPGGKVLDLCAGNGGKTLAIAALLSNRGVVAATDVHEGRLRALRERAARAGAMNLAVHALGAGDWPPAVVQFAAHADRILVDAPCTGTGSWRRRPEGRWLVAPAALATLQREQDQLLARAAAALRPGARLVYATCSLLTAENEDRVTALRARCPELEPVRIVEILGGEVGRPIADATGTYLSVRPDRHGCDGFFAAVLRKRSR